MPEEKLNRPDPEYADVRASIVELLRAARAASARNFNAVMTATYFEIGRRIVESEMRGENRAGYGEQLAERLAGDLTRRFGRGSGKANLWQMWDFYRAGRIKKFSSPSGERSPPLHVFSCAARFRFPGLPICGCFA